MTFYEAALEVLRSARRPLHYKKITELAIKKNLLSHVGRTPEVTMGARLGQELERTIGVVEIVRKRPGVYALRDWEHNPPEPVPEPDSEPRRRRRRAQRRTSLDAESAAGQQPEPQDLQGAGSTDSARNAPVTRSGAPKAHTEHSPVQTRNPEPTSTNGSRTEEPDAPRAEKPAAGPSSGANAVVNLVLDELRRSGEPMSSRELARALPDALADTATHAAALAALVTDNHVRQTQGRRPRFVRLDDGGWALTEWALDDETLALEQQLHASVAKLRDNTVNALASKIRKLPLDAWQHLVLALLKKIGYVVLGQTSQSASELVIRTEHTVGVSTIRIAIQLIHAPRLSAEAVTDLRGTLHHHGSSRGVIFTTGEVSDEALAEGDIPNLPPITLIGCRQLASMMLDAGIGVRRFDIPAHYIDHSFFAALKG